MAENLSNLDSPQIIKDVYDHANDSLKVTVVADSSGGTGNGTNLSNGLNVQGSFNVDYTSIPATAGSPHVITAGMAEDTTSIVVQEQTGARLQLLVDGVFFCFVAPGQDTPINALIPAGSEVSVKSDESSAPAAGSLIITFLG